MTIRTHERRIMPLELREAVKGSNGRQRWATAVTYGTVDDYGSGWTPGVFTEALSQRMPTILYGHDWYNLDHVLGTGIDSREMDYGVDVLMEFADPAKVPPAGRAMHLVEQKIITDVSVGFLRTEWREGTELTADEIERGAREMIDSAEMDELSLVVRGAVPGAGIRGRRGAAYIDDVVEIARRKAAGEISADEAKAAVELLGKDEAPSEGASELELTDEDQAKFDLEAAAALAEAEAQLQADADGALDLVLGRSRPR
jgi:HK97 family phage prohead protease